MVKGTHKSFKTFVFVLSSHYICIKFCHLDLGHFPKPKPVCESPIFSQHQLSGGAFFFLDLFCIHLHFFKQIYLDSKHISQKNKTIWAFEKILMYKTRRSEQKKKSHRENMNDSEETLLQNIRDSISLERANSRAKPTDYH